MRRVGLLALTLVLGAAAAVTGCTDDTDAPPDGFTSVGMGDTYGEWELFAEFEGGEWTGCLRIDHYDVVERCADPADGLVTFESGDGAMFGAVPEGGELVFGDGRTVPLQQDRFFVLATGAEIRPAR